MLLTELVEKYDWIEINRKIQINCFLSNPSIKSSLKFLRKTDWARMKVENIYLALKYTQSRAMFDQKEISPTTAST